MTSHRNSDIWDYSQSYRKHCLRFLLFFITHSKPRHSSYTGFISGRDQFYPKVEGMEIAHEGAEREKAGTLENNNRSKNKNDRSFVIYFIFAITF